MLYKTVAAPDRGLNYSSEPHLIDSREWLTLQSLRSFKGRIVAFPGWISLLASGNVGAYGTLAVEYLQFAGTQIFVVGGPTTVYRYNPATMLLTSITAAPFGTSRDDPWWPFIYQDELFIVNKIDGMFRWNGAGNLLAVANAPKAKSACFLRDHILTLNYDDGVDNPLGFKWCSEAAVTIWTPLASNDAGSFALRDTPDVGVLIDILGEEAVAYKEQTIVPIRYIGGNEVFATRQMIKGIGLVGKYALINLGEEHAFMGNDRFYVYAGGQNLDIQFGDKVNRYVYDRLHPTLRNRSQSLFIRKTDELIWAYPTIASTGDCNEFVVYNRKEKAWYGPTPILASIFGQTRRAGTLVVDDISAIVDTVPTIVDQYPTTIGGRLNVFIGTSGNILKFDETNYSDNGTAQTRIAESGDHFLGADAIDDRGIPVQIPLGSIFTVTGINFELSDRIQTGTIKIQLGFREELKDPVAWSTPQTIDIATTKFFAEFRNTGRWFRIRFTIENSQPFELSAYQFIFAVTGRR